jgi:hypothetical protein
MTDVLALFAVLFGVYLLQCIAWIGSGDVAFRADWRLRGKPARRFLSVGREYRLFFLNPLSPLAGAIVCESIPEIRVEPREESGQVASEQPPGAAAEPLIVLRQGQKEAFRAVGRNIVTADTLVYKARSQVFANVLVEFLEILRNSPTNAWSRIFRRQYEKMLDASRVASRLSEYRLYSGFLRTTTFLVFVFVFGIAPLEIRIVGLGRVWPFLTAYIVMMLALTSWGFLRAQKNLYPGQPEGRWQHALTFALSPLSAIRANDFLLRDLLCAFHPLAVARIIMTEKEFQVEAERELRQAIYLRRSAWSAEGVQLALEAFIRDAGLNPDELLKPPLRESINSSAYCPLCLSQFVIDEGECPDCTGVQLKKYSSRNELRGRTTAVSSEGTPRS